LGILLASGAPVDIRRDSKSPTPLHMAILQNSRSMQGLLSIYGARWDTVFRGKSATKWLEAVERCEDASTKEGARKALQRTTFFGQNVIR
jgi:hypothetical protein